MYLLNRDVYACDFCETEIPWDGTDPVNGDMWGCERCECNFCTKCFTDRFGYDAFRVMLATNENVLCPDCFGEVGLDE